MVVSLKHVEIRLEQGEVEMTVNMPASLLSFKKKRCLTSKAEHIIWLRIRGNHLPDNNSEENTMVACVVQMSSPTDNKSLDYNLNEEN